MSTAKVLFIAAGVGVTVAFGYMVYDKYYGKTMIAGTPVNLNQVASQAKRGVFGVGISAPMVTL